MIRWIAEGMREMEQPPIGADKSPPNPETIILITHNNYPILGLIIDRERFKRLFPHLAEEMERETVRIPIDAYRVDPDEGERLTRGDRWAGYNPDVIDFLRRCDTVEEAEEIIEYLERRGEITKERAEELRKRLCEGGTRSFGEKKEPGYYLRDL